ncbi:MAG: ComF family protein [Pseudomonadota bacterium]
MSSSFLFAPALWTRLRRLGRAAIDVLVPPHCPVSGEPVSAPALLSGPGWQQLGFIEAPFCPGCAVPFALDHGPGTRCGRCVGAAGGLDQTRAALLYDDTSVPLVVAFKHGDRTDYAPLLARLMIRAGRDLFAPDAVLIPVPLHVRRLRARRYNQAALLSQQVGAATGLAVDVQSLIRHRNTPPQKDLSPDARQRNVAGAFAVRDEAADAIKGRHVILVDDVYTTGSTLSACASRLRRAGASRVDALVLARVVKGGAAAI